MRPNGNDATPKSAGRAAAGIAWISFKSAMFVSALTGATIAVMVLTAMLVVAIVTPDVDVESLAGAVVILTLGLAIGVAGGIVLAALPTFLVGFGMTLLSLFQPFVRHWLTWAAGGATCGFFLIELSLVFPPHAVGDDLLGLRAALVPVGALHAVLYRRWTLPEATRLWQHVVADFDRAS